MRRRQKRDGKAKGGHDAFDDATGPAEAESADSAFFGPRADELDIGFDRVTFGDDAGEQRRVDSPASRRTVVKGWHVVNFEKFAVRAQDCERAANSGVYSDYLPAHGRWAPMGR
jgi:hypothetical protein